MQLLSGSSQCSLHNKPYHLPFIRDTCLERRNSQLSQATDSESNMTQSIVTVAVALAWTAMIVASSVGIIIWRELFTVEPEWWPWIHGAILVAILGLSVAYGPTRPMWRYFSILVIIFFLGFGGGWNFGLVPMIRSSAVWNSWIVTIPVPYDSLAVHALRLTPAFAVLTFLLVTGRRPKDFYLIKGQIDADAEPSRLLGMKSPEAWTKLARPFIIIFVVVTIVFLVIGNQPTAEQLMDGLPLLPAALLIAMMNGFNEEFTLRAAPLSELEPRIGKLQGLMITSFYFGFGHFYGIPSGIIGVALSAFLGYFLGKSMLETRGFFWAWLIHFLPDVFIFYFLLSLPV
jgi:hypothetical protein